MATEIFVNPNPFTRSINIEINCPDRDDCIILLADLQNSKIVRILGAGLSKGVNKIAIEDLHSLETGNYQLDIKNTDGERLYAAKLSKE
jgi:hypothetical protein